MKKNYLFLIIGLFWCPTLLLSQFSVSGKITRHNGEPVPNIEVHSYGTVTTDINGEYEFTDVPLNHSTPITTSGNFDKFEDVTVLDLLVVARHILGVNGVDNYQLLAGDINNSVSVTSLDLLKLNRLALHIDDNIAPEWRCIDADYDFQMPNSNNPGQIEINVTSDIENANFIAVKRGDVAISSDYIPAPSSAPNPVMTISNEYFQAGDDVEFELTVFDFTNIMGFQGTYEWDPNLLELESVIDFTGSNIVENFSANLDYLDDGLLPHLFFSSKANSIGIVNGSPILTFKFKAMADAPSAQTEILKFSDQLTPRQIVWKDPVNDELFILEGNYINGESTTSVVSAPNGLENFQIFPNPIEKDFHVKVLLENAEDFEILIMNVLGQKVFSKNFNQKELLLEIDFNEFPSGTYFLSLQTANGIHTESFVKQ